MSKLCKGEEAWRRKKEGNRKDRDIFMNRDTLIMYLILCRMQICPNNKDDQTETSGRKIAQQPAVPTILRVP